MELEINSFSDITDKAENPFIEKFKINERFSFKRFKKGEAVYTDKITRKESIELTEQNTKLIKSDLGIGKIKRTDSSPFVLLYTDEAINYMNMNPLTIKVLMFIMYERTSLGSDFIVTGIQDIVDNLKISKASAYTSLFELTKYKVIDKRNEHNWWINPAYFYCGNRLSINTK